MLIHCHYSTNPSQFPLEFTHISTTCTPPTCIIQPTTSPTALYKTPHVWPHTLVGAVGFNLYSSIKSWTTSAWPSSAAKCSTVNPKLPGLWSRDCIFGARYWIVLIWPLAAALWRAFHPSYMRETHNNWTQDWFNIGVDMDNGHTSTQDSMLCEWGGLDRVWLCIY